VVLLALELAQLDKESNIHTYHRRNHNMGQELRVLLDRLADNHNYNMSSSRDYRVLDCSNFHFLSSPHKSNLDTEVHRQDIDLPLGSHHKNLLAHMGIPVVDSSSLDFEQDIPDHRIAEHRFVVAVQHTLAVVEHILVVQVPRTQAAHMIDKEPEHNPALVEHTAD
jgi:hypothetical protein